jgi:diguanylate cyclase (GGDEF)-like protein
MRDAAKAARLQQERFGCTWAEAMSVALKSASGVTKLARHIQLAANAGDRFSRRGGDEFLPVASADTDGLGRCLMEALEELPPLDLRDGGRLRLSVSIGVAQALTPDDAWPDLMRRADRALSEAKASGRCRIACAA